MPDPGTLRAAAARLSQLAGVLPVALDRAARDSGLDVWLGPVADRFDGDLEGERGALRRAGSELRDVAGAVLVAADRLQAQLALAARPAPVQMQWLGFPGTLGAPWIDYIVADRVLIRPQDEYGLLDLAALLQRDTLGS